MRAISRKSGMLVAAAFAALAVIGAFGAGGVPTQEAKLTGSDAGAGDYFGTAVAMDGVTAVAGAPFKSASQGAAYVFTRAGTDWTEQGKLVASDAADGDSFGAAVAVAGDTAVVGAYAKNSLEGAAYVFLRTGTSWAPDAKLTAADASAGDRFGWNVAIAGDTAVIGAPYDDSNRGAAYVFTRTAGTWTQQKLTAADGAGFEYFGYSVGIAGDTLVVGTPRGSANAGAVYVFTRSGATWTQDAKLTAGDGASDDQLGRSVAISGDTVSAGASYAHSTQGAVYVFTRTSGTWTQQAKLSAADAANGDYLGDAVAVAGDTAFAGVSARSGAPGVVYVFTRTGTSWAQQTALVAGDAANDDGFGISAAVAGDTAVAGTRSAAYVFALAPRVEPPAAYCVATKVTAKANKRRMQKSTLTASGILDTGVGKPDFTGPATFDVGGFHLGVPAFVRKGASLTYGDGVITLTVTPSRIFSSRALFSAKVVGDLTGKVGLDAPLQVGFRNDFHDLDGNVRLKAGVLGPHCVITPTLCVLGASATLNGPGRDALKLTLAFATDGAVPDAGEDLTIGFGGKYKSPVLPGASFVHRRNRYVYSAKAPGITQAIVDYVKGTITVSGSRLDLGTFVEGGNPVIVSIARGADTRAAGIRMARSRTKLAY